MHTHILSLNAHSQLFSPEGCAVDCISTYDDPGERADQSKTHFREYLYNDKCYAHETCIYDSLYVRLHAVKNSLQVIMY